MSDVWALRKNGEVLFVGLSRGACFDEARWRNLLFTHSHRTTQGPLEAEHLVDGVEVVLLTELDKESLARALYQAWDQSGVPWILLAPDCETRRVFREGVDAVHADIERQGFQITRMVPITGRVNEQDEPQ